MALPDVADEIAVWEHEASIDEIDADTVASIYFSLYHTHVPKLETAGVVEYHQEEDLLTLTDRGRTVTNRGTESKYAP
ncbi:hypothetical protein VB773_21890 [Haloarculaceae archaeon H-GB2-1]|nr:hypothetical protein [Haloarculaceae archaeon H-GB1-1]MEA5389591.1 hypothetical protein [Haloarculaceae archaeon H-GB11]MEA5409957.1 hypothetical protein [Haloarculaceae archaeon H-GB2-1]